MTVEPEQLDFDEAMRRQHAAIEQVTENADPTWLEHAERIIVDLPAGTEFTTDDVWVTLLAAGVDTHEPRALGGVTRRLQTGGVIVNTKAYRASQRPANHGRPVPVWRRS